MGSEKFQACRRNFTIYRTIYQRGVTTEYLDSLIHQFMVGRRAIPATLDYNGFPKSCCISLNEVVCHGIPSPQTILKKGDILNVDITTILDGTMVTRARCIWLANALQKH